MFNDTLDTSEILEGDIVQYEEKYYAAAIVEVLEVCCSDDEVKVKVEIIEPIFGYIDVGQVIELMKNKHSDLASCYNIWKLKEPGSMTEYINTDFDTDMGDIDEYFDYLEEKYSD